MRRLLDEVLAQRQVRVVFQPVVDLDRTTVVGFEALSQGPAGTPLERPDRLFAAARDAGRLAELDRLCQQRDGRAALDGVLRSPATLLFNAEPEAMGPPPRRCHPPCSNAPAPTSTSWWSSPNPT